MNLSVKLRRTASAALSLGGINADATRPRRIEWYDVILGCEAPAADNPFLYIFQRYTAAGTATAVAPQKLDPADAVTECDAAENHTVDPTYTANEIVLEIPLNQRATFRWLAVEGGRLISPATASNGIGISTPTSAALAITATAHVNER